MGRFVFVSFLFFLRKDFSDGMPVSLSLYSVKFHQHPTMVVKQECVSECVSLWYME